jgi:DNA-binding beta-propeller fold protein YncE
MKRNSTVVLLLIMFFTLTVNAQERRPLKLIQTTPLTGFTGDFDHFAIDLQGKRLFLTAEDHKTVEVFDLEGNRVHSITGFGQPHAALFLHEVNQLIVTDGDDFGMVELVDGTNYKILSTIRLPGGVDGAVYNPVDHCYYVESGGDDANVKTHVLNIIDTKTFKHVGDITLPGNHSEAMAVDHEGKKLYVNLTGVNQVGVVDLKSRKVLNTWPVPETQTTNSLVLDEPNQRLFIAGRKPPKLVILNAVDGKELASFPISGLNDDMWFDAANKRIYATGTETTTVFEQVDADHYKHVADVPTGFRAKTSIFVPELKRLYVAVSGKGKPNAQLALQVYDVVP